MVYENFGDELAAAMVKDLSSIPAGPERSEECRQRLEEASEGLVQIQLILGETEQALARDAGTFVGGLDACAQRLVWVTEMTDGIRRGIRGLEEFDRGSSEDYPYQAVKACLTECDERRTRLQGQVAALEPSTVGVDAVTGSTLHASVEGKSMARIVGLGKVVRSDCLSDLINDLFAEEFTLLVESFEWLFKPTVLLFELLSPTARHLTSEARLSGLKTRQ